MTPRYLSLEEISEAKYKHEKDLRLVSEWCCKNSLLINAEKTKFLVRSRHAVAKFITRKYIFNIFKQAKTILPVTFINDLEITTDRNLTYSKHISQLTSECEINRVKYCFDQNTLWRTSSAR